ncbi:hypothetical protein ACIPX0_45645 [Streptomyces sp. NPDC090075]|uniref:hypothetical protein n=1 Tax=Streptomyces sp. NPDC090075 TaxID=3365937 RepID=UPI003801A564
MAAEPAAADERLLLKVLTEEPLFTGLTQDEQDALEGLLKRALHRVEILKA